MGRRFMAPPTDDGRTEHTNPARENKLREKKKKKKKGREKKKRRDNKENKNNDTVFIRQAKV